MPVLSLQLASSICIASLKFIVPSPFFTGKINIVHFSVSEVAGIDAHDPVIGVQDKPAFGKGKIHLRTTKGSSMALQQLAAAGIPQLYGRVATILLNSHQAVPCLHRAGI